MVEIKGFLSPKESKKLQELFQKVHKLGPILEIGTYCGKSAINFAEVAKKFNGLVFSVDHHTGSEEHQLGEEYHDDELFDKRLNKFNTLPEFLKNVILYKKSEYIIPILDESKKQRKGFLKKLVFCLLTVDMLNRPH